jgi:DNA-binding FadR family transcriptional regulator
VATGEDTHADRKRLAALIRADIETGKYPPGARLPSQRQLEQRHGAARNTVGAALRLLQAEGLVDIRPNSGAYVRDPQATPRPRDVRAELRELQDQLHRTKRELAAAQKQVAGLLDSLPPGTQDG